jgi:hypothetical protein
MTKLRRLPAISEQPTTSATAMVTGRIFLLDDPRYTYHVPLFLAAGRSGLVLSGKGSNAKAKSIGGQSASLLLSDPSAYLDQVATEEEPFALPGNVDTLFGSDLDPVLDGQRQCHTAAAITPSRYVQAGDSAAFKALVRHAQAIERDDVIIAVPVALPWLTQQQYLPQLIAGLQRIPHPKAIMFGAQNNPFDAAPAIPNFRRLLAETTNVGLWRADVPAAFDCLAYGGAFAAIGAGGSLRHLVPPDEKPKADNPVIHTPAVLLPSMLRYSQGRFIATKYANTPAPRCNCVICAGASLDRFDSLSGEVRATAHAHNAAVWTSWLSELFGHTTDRDRQLWWRGFCQAALDAHEHENTRLRQKGAFKPSPALKKLATLPVPAEAEVYRTIR